MQFDLLCSGSKGNCCLIRHRGHSFLIDCGAPSSKYLEEALRKVNSSTKEIEAVLVTHSHRDHMGKLYKFRKLPIYAGCRLSMRDREKQPIRFKKVPVHPDQPFELFGLKITPIQLSHDAGPTVGYLLQDEEESLVYVTDTGYFRSRYYGPLSNATYYIFESNYNEEMLRNCSRPRVVKNRIRSDRGHLSNEDSASHLISMIGQETKQVVLAHISGVTNTPELALKALKKESRKSGKPLSHVQLEAAGQYSITSSIA